MGNSDKPDDEKYSIKKYIEEVKSKFEDDDNVVLIYNDCFKVIKLKVLISEKFDIASAEKKLLDIRTFNPKRENRMYRDYAGRPFFKPIDIDDDDNMKDCDSYYDYQYLDKKEAELKDNELWVHTSGGGSYQFPEEEKEKNKIKIKNYIKYDENGQAYIFAWRLAEFL